MLGRETKFKVWQVLAPLHFLTNTGTWQNGRFVRLKYMRENILNSFKCFFSCQGIMHSKADVIQKSIKDLHLRIIGTKLKGNNKIFGVFHNN